MEQKIDIKYKYKLKSLKLDELHTVFVEACRYGKLNIVEYLLTSKELTKNVNIEYENNLGFRIACYKGRLNIVKYLLTSKNLEKKADINDGIDENNGLIWAAEAGRLKVVKYLLTSNELDIKAKFEKHNYKALIGASNAGKESVLRFLFSLNPNIRDVDYQNIFSNVCTTGSVNAIKMLLTEEKHKEKINIKDNINEWLRQVTVGNNVEVFKYLLTYCNNLNINVDIHADQDKLFKNSYIFKKKKILDFLIYELNINKTEDIHNLLLSKGDDGLMKILEIQANKKILEESLVSHMVDKRIKTLKI